MVKRGMKTRYNVLSENRQLCDCKQVVIAKIRLVVCGVTTHQEAKKYIEDAVSNWGGQFEFPSEDNNFAGNPLCTRFIHLLETTVYGGRFDQKDVIAYLQAKETYDLLEYPDDVE